MTPLLGQRTLLTTVPETHEMRSFISTRDKIVVLACVLYLQSNITNPVV